MRKLDGIRDPYLIFHVASLCEGESGQVIYETSFWGLCMSSGKKSSAQSLAQAVLSCLKSLLSFTSPSGGGTELATKDYCLLQGGLEWLEGVPGSDFSISMAQTGQSGSWRNKAEPSPDRKVTSARSL